ncbi:unnamed protein product [Fraxinus pennsylvanica]|uniref:GIR1-like zinc ribbon domain-containing protein n=1 Tax=Fraxinus pennsylvanica TaxID=56036 RepID=A0AAD2DK50_9LAMI|nr:unnamed protein product [Fraxinus pennsylvanica]
MEVEKQRNKVKMKKRRAPEIAIVGSDDKRVVKGGEPNESELSSGKSTTLITRDLLGRCCTLDSKELDLELQVPSGWEKRLDLKSGNVFLQRCDSSISSSSTSENKPHGKTVAKLKDLNFYPASKQTLNLFHNASLDLKTLVPPPSTSKPSSNYRSICTLDKVKSALKKAENESTKKRSISMSKSLSTHSSSSSSVKDCDSNHEEKMDASVATGCPNCLLYVLISKSNPNCPQCNNIVLLPMQVKKPRFDLNITI